jgi:hypothetical protein
MTRTRHLPTVHLLLAALLVAATAGLVVAAAPAGANTGAQLAEGFDGPTLGVPGNWNASATGEPVCLTARSSTAAPIAVGPVGATAPSGIVAGCYDPADAAGQGVLRLTSTTGGQAATFLYNSPLPLSGGLDITFKLSMWGGTGADGISFFLKDGANADDSPGASGGSLGYGLFTTTAGIQGALIGIGFDRFGNFSGSAPAADCPAPNATTGDLGSGSSPNTLVVRGPDLSADADGTCGYYLLGSQEVDFTSGAGDREGRAREVRVVIDPPSGAAPKVKVFLGPVGALPTTPTLEVDQPTVFSTTPTFKFGFSASTGGSTNNHEVWDLGIGATAAVAAPAAAAPPTLVCEPDPYRTGETVTCRITGGPPNSDILWHAYGDGVLFGAQGVTLDADGTGIFTFIATSADTIRVELVEWNSETSLRRIDGSAGLPVRIPAGEGAVPVRAPVGAVIVLALLALAALSRGRAGASGTA